MGYEYSDPAREADPNALPNVEIWLAPILECQECGAQHPSSGAREDDPAECPECSAAEYGPVGHAGWWYAFGFPGCLHDSEPCGPYDTREQALDAAREE